MTALKHVILRASAGTGKTFELSNRFIALLFLGVKPESILATTFTRKAAGEVLDRVMLRLARGASDEAQAAQLQSELGFKYLNVDRGRCLAVLTQVCRSLHRLSISTIDSFMAAVAGSFHHELGLPNHPTMVGEDDPKVERLRMEAIEALLAEDEPDVLVDLLRRLHHDAAQRSVSRALDAIVSDLYEVYRQAPQAEVWDRLPVPPGAMDESKLAQFIERLRELGDALPKSKGGQPNKTWAKEWSKLTHAATVRHWDAVMASKLVQAVTQVEPKYAGVDVSSDWLDVLGPIYDHAKASQLQYVARQTQATHELLQRFDAHYTRLRLQQKVLLFGDLPQVLARELPRVESLQTELYYRLDARVEHLLLDEFQDTSLDQWQVLEPLAQEVCSVGDGSRTFFCVGDLKQAIYAWRGGCAELFDKVTADLHLLDVQASLTKSYRSSQCVLNVVNQVFSGIGDNEALKSMAPQALVWQARYERHEAARDLPGYVELVTSTATPIKHQGDTTSDEVADGQIHSAEADDRDAQADDESDDEQHQTSSAAKRDAHIQYVAGRVRALHERLRGQSIGILVRGNKMIRPLLFALGEQGVPASGEGGNTLTDDPAVNAVLAAFTLADHPGDQVAAFHVRHAPLGRVVGLTGLDKQMVERVSGELRQQLITQGYAETITAWSRQMAAHCGERSLQRLAQLVELADAFEPEASLRPSRFVEFVQQTPVQEPSPSAVRVMTIHKSKGLEFDQVVLPELHAELARMVGQSVYVLRPRPTEPIAAVFRGTNKQVRALSPLLEEAYQQEQARKLQDNLCALYVAMTRARHGLLMIAKPRALNKNGKLSSKGWSNACYASVLRQALSVTVEEKPQGEQVLFAHGDRCWYESAEAPQVDVQQIALVEGQPPAEQKPSELESTGDDARTDFQATPWQRGTRRQKAVTAPSMLENQGRIKAGDLFRPPAEDGRRFGTFIHACLEQIEWLEEGEALPDDDLFWQAATRAMPGTDRVWLRDSLAKLRQMLRQQAVRKLLVRPVGLLQLWRERAFLVPDGDRLLGGKFDRVVIHESIDADNRVARTALLLDFKTDSLQGGPQAMAQTIERYKPQMQAYRWALQSMLKLDEKHVRVQLVFLSVGRVVDLQ